MASDARAQQARKHHAAAQGADTKAAQHREQRDQLVRALRGEDPVRWTYGALAKTVGCSPELIALIVKGGQDV